MSPIYTAIIIGSIGLNVLLLVCITLKYKPAKTERPERPRRFNIIKFSKRIVIIIFALLISYVITVLIIFVKTGMEPATLTENLFGFFSAEGGFLAIIKITEGIVEKIIIKKDISPPDKENKEE